MFFYRFRDAVMALTVIATPVLFGIACACAYAERGYMACGGEFAVLALPLIVGAIVYGGEDD